METFFVKFVSIVFLVYICPMETEKKITEGALRLYLKYGVKSVTMDDVAKYLGVSKKTLYQYVSNKVELIDKCLTMYFDEHVTQIEAIIKETSNPIDELLSIDKNVCGAANERNPSLFYEIQKYYPAIYKKLMEISGKYTYSSLINNLELGIEMGLYRDDMNIQIIAKFYVARIDNLIDTDIFPVAEFDFKELVDQNFMYHLRGIVSRKGLDYLEQTMS